MEDEEEQYDTEENEEYVEKEKPSPTADSSTGAHGGQPLTAEEGSLPEMIKYPKPLHIRRTTWHLTLNNTTSTRPKDYGGKVVQSVAHCKAYHQDAPCKHNCKFTLPNGFAPGDGIVLETAGEGANERAASEAA